MKKFLLLITLIVLSGCQSMRETTVSMDPVIEIIETQDTKDALYVKANNWMVETFNNAKSVIQFSDKESGTVTGRYLLEENSIYVGYTLVERTIYAIIKIEVKDNAARITISPQPFQSTHSPGQAKEITITKVNTLINSFKNYLSKEDVAW